MSSNFPPGVTGREPEIAGPLSETDEERYCPPCRKHVTTTVIRWATGQSEWECPDCETEYTEDVDDVVQGENQ